MPDLTTPEEEERCPTCGGHKDYPLLGLYGTWIVGTEPVEIPATHCPDSFHKPSP